MLAIDAEFEEQFGFQNFGVVRHGGALLGTSMIVGIWFIARESIHHPVYTSESDNFYHTFVR
jgi:hypothetical protein